jgi:hypothetical protein
LTSLAFAQDEVFLTFPSAGPREIWVSTGLPSDVSDDSTRTEQTSLTLSIEGKRAGDAIFIWDKREGNLASKNLGEVRKAGKWEVKTTDFIDIAEVAVEVQHAGMPVSAAIVSLNDGRRTQQEFLDPSMKGTVKFFAVKPGSLKIKVEYKSLGKDAKPVTQLLDAALSRAEAVPTLKVSLPEPVEVNADAKLDGAPATSPAQTGEKKPDAAAAEPPRASPFGSAIGYLIGLALAIGAAYFAIQYFKKNQDTVGSKLEQLGVQIPKPQDDDLTMGDPVVPAPIKPAPPQKIVLDDADPTLLASSASPDPSMTPVVTGQPRLVSETGDEMPLEEGELEVGREVGLGLSLIGETTVSRRHAQLVRAGNSVIVKDLGSTNGTYVNGVKLDGEQVLRPGDQVQFGSVRFRYQG